MNIPLTFKDFFIKYIFIFETIEESSLTESFKLGVINLFEI